MSFGKKKEYTGKDKDEETPQVVVKTGADAAVTEAPPFKDMKEMVATSDDKKDDPELATHPTKDYDLQNNASRIADKRQFQPDLLCRQLNCTVFSLNVHKAWAKNPLGGRPVDVVYTREFPQAGVLYDNFDAVPENSVLEYKKELAHAHGFIYIVQYPGRVLNSDELERQLAEEKKVMKQEKVA